MLDDIYKNDFFAVIQFIKMHSFTFIKYFIVCR